MTKVELLDSVAVSKTLMTVEKNVTNGGTLHELDVREILKAGRREVSPIEYKGFNQLRYRGDIFRFSLVYLIKNHRLNQFS